MWPSLKPSQRVALAATIPPQSLAGGSSLTSAYVSAGVFKSMLAKVSIGAITAGGSVSIAVLQATSSGGANAKALNAIVGQAPLADTGLATSNTEVLVNIRNDECDTNNGFAYVAIQVSAVADPALVQADLFGFDCATGDASYQNPASVVAVLG
jgi:hypothetical protein